MLIGCFRHRVLVSSGRRPVNPSPKTLVKPTPISSLDHPSLIPYRTLRRPLEHHRLGIFVAEGSKVVLRLLETEFSIISMLLTPEWFDRCVDKIGARTPPPEVFVGEQSILENIVGFHLHQGIMAVCRIPPSLSLDDVLRVSRRPYFLVAVDGLTNAENLGALVRNCVAFGVQGLLVGETSSSPFLRRAVRNSMGAVFALKIIEAQNLAESLRELSLRHSIRPIAAHPHAERQTLYATDFTTDCCLVFGSEGEGISDAVLDACAERTKIPMAEGVDSLNVASASAAFLAEANRQRNRSTP